jgi:Domain of unknown function (DUF4105)
MRATTWRPERLLAQAVLVAALGWAGFALWNALPGPSWLVRTLAIVLPLGAALALAWYFSTEPSNSGDWQPDVSRLTHGDLNGDTLTLHNVRNFTCRSETDFTPCWETRTYDLAKLEGLDMFFCHWSSPKIAHTILSWCFANAAPLAISIETRKVVGQEYSAVAGFFRRYPIYYVAADERDVIGVRTNFRGENVFLYRLKTPPENARRLLLDYVKSMNALVERPEWYNAFTANCTTTIRQHVRHLSPGSFPLDWRLLMNGYLDELLYERGVLDTSRPFAELQTISTIDARGKAAGDSPDFSTKIREGLPNPLAAP